MTTTPAIDYTNKDFASLREAMLELARYRLPEWTDRSASDMGMLLVDLFAYLGDISFYYLDRTASECFLDTASERRSVVDLLRLVGYELAGPVAAGADLTLLFTPPGGGEDPLVTIPEGATFESTDQGQGAQSFQYTGPELPIDLSSHQVETLPDGRLAYGGLPVRHSRLVSDEILGSSTGEIGESFPLGQAPLIPGSLRLEVDEGAGWVAWQERENLLYHELPSGRIGISGPDSRDYSVRREADGIYRILVGDGTHGRRLPVGGVNNVRASYRVGGGEVGNVPAGAISTANTAIQRLDAVVNPAPAAGGTGEEDLERARRFGPLAFRSGQRAVTLGDYVALAFQAGGVAKVRAVSRGWNQVDLHIAPEGATCRPVPDDLRSRLLEFFEDRRMVSTLVRIRDAACVPVDLSLRVVVAHHYTADEVRQRVAAAVEGLLAFERVDFGHTVFVSKVYEAVEAVDGVFAATVTRFKRQDAPDEIAAVLAELGLTSVDELPELLRRGLDVQVASDGRIEIDELEIPVLGELELVMDEVAP